MARLISTVMLLLVTLVVGVLFYQVMVGFFVPLFLAALLVVLFRPWHAWFIERTHGRQALAAILTTTTIMIVVLLPALAVLGIAAVQSTTLLTRVNYNTLAFALERTRERFGLEVDDIESIELLRETPTRLGNLQDLTNPKYNERGREWLGQAKQILGSLETAYGPLKPNQVESFDEFRATIDRLDSHLRLILAEANEDERAANRGRDATAAILASGTSGADAEAEGPVSAKPLSGVDEEELPEASGNTAVSGAEPNETGSDEELPTTGEPSENNPNLSKEEDLRSPEERFHRGVMTLERQGDDVISGLLGGAIRSQLALAVNPSREELSDRLQQLREYIQPKLVSMTSATGEFLFQLMLGLGILVISLYFFLVDGPKMVRTLMRLSPLDDRYEAKLLVEFDRTSRAVVLATVLSALAQGILATVGYYFAGFESIVFLFLLTTFMALIPFLGAAVVWVPCAVWLILVEERTAAALILLVYGAVIVSSADNLVKVFVLGGKSQLHPLFALLSILGGVHVFGPIGILVGPMVVVFLQSMLEILNHELSELEHSSDPDPTKLAGDLAGAGEPLFADPHRKPDPPEAKTSGE